MVTVRCFAGIREILGHDTLSFTPAKDASTAADVLAAVAGAHLPGLPQPILVAINREHAALTSPVHDGDEVAFFPPVSGG
ncbi:MAG TPA: MoaD/ThiS family protein [Acidiferrobacter sp.]|nr:MoaD/ThiS family protein [Acidiferrobacter sp.]